MSSLQRESEDQALQATRSGKTWAPAGRPQRAEDECGLGSEDAAQPAFSSMAQKAPHLVPTSPPC